MKKAIMVLLLILEIGMMSVLIYLLCSQKNTLTITEQSFEFLLTLISIAISIWAGLNIYNVIEKSEFEHLKKEVENEKKSYENTVMILTKQLASAKNDLKELYEQQKEITENIVEERRSIFEANLNINNTWYKPFKELCHDNNSQTTFKIFGYLTQVEKMYYGAYKADEQNVSIEALKYCEEGLDILNTCKKLFDNSAYCTSKNNLWYSFYLQIRESDFYYFMGNYYRLYARNNEKSKSYYERELDILKHIDYLIRESELNINDSFCLAKHYNTIAVSYVFLMDLVDPSQSMYQEYSLMAYRYSQNSIDTKYANSKAYRNYGVILERRKEYNRAKAAYKKSVSKNPREYKSYLCLASLLLKEITQQLEIEHKDSFIFKKVSLSQKKHLKKQLENILANLNLGMGYAPVTDDFHNKLGWCYSFLCLLEDDPSQALFYYNEGERHLNIVEQVRPEITKKNKNRLHSIGIQKNIFVKEMAVA